MSDTPKEDIEPEDETAYLLKNPAMRKRLLEAMASDDTIQFEVVRARLGI